MTALDWHPTDYVLKITGDKHTSEGIFADDHLIVRQQATAEPGQLVIATVNGEGSLKRYEPEDRVLGLVTWVMGRRS